MSRSSRWRVLCLALIIIAFSSQSAIAHSTKAGSGELPLHFGWRLQSSCQIHADGAQISTPGFATTGWHSTSVPATVVAALVADGTYPDPHYGMNLRKIPGTTYPIGKIFANLPMPRDSPFACSWWYRKQFSLPNDFSERTVWLHFEGINYRANIWINGEKFADSRDVAGAYRIYDLDVTPFLKPGTVNAVAVETFAPTEKDLAMNWVDWNPAPPDKDMGLWGDVFLTTTGPVAVDYPEVITHFRDQSLKEADLTVVAQVRNASKIAVTATVQGTIGSVHFAQDMLLQAGEAREVTFPSEKLPQLRVKNPKVWWPYGLGPQNLETLALEARVRGVISETKQIPFGIREVTSEMNSENHVLFRINGKTILIRGGGWAPDMLMRQSRRKLEAQFDYVREMGLNTIRLEGKLEPDNFFDLADERGVLVMAGWCCCSIWEQWAKWAPADLQNASAQLRSQILRLRGHPSLLVWLNGSDEPPPADVEREYLKIEHELQWPNPTISSASHRPAEFSGASGVKMFGPYDYVPPEYWLEDTKRGGAWGFNTETSAGAAPMVDESLKKTMPANEIWPPNEYWHFHAAGGRYQRLTAFDNAMTQMYGAPQNLADYERKAQAMTYENERAMFEAYARNKYSATGVVQWMLNNAWPSLFWHLYDYYLQPAGGYFGTKKANEMLHVQYSYDDRSVVVVNGFYHPVAGLRVEAAVYDFDLHSVFSRRVETSLSADESKRVLTIPAFPETEPPKVYFVKLALLDRFGRVLSSNFYWLSSRPAVFTWDQSTDAGTRVTSYENLQMLDQLPRVKLDATADPNSAREDEVLVKLHNASSHLAFQITLAIRDANGKEILPVFWSDNYLELLPGESRRVSARFPAWVKLKNGTRLDIAGWNIELETVQLFHDKTHSAKHVLPDFTTLH